MNVFKNDSFIIIKEEKKFLTVTQWYQKCFMIEMMYDWCWHYIYQFEIETKKILKSSPYTIRNIFYSQSLHIKYHLFILSTMNQFNNIKIKQAASKNTIYFFEMGGNKIVYQDYAFHSETR